MTFSELLTSIPSPSSRGFELGPLSITYYAVAITFGALAALSLATQRWRQRGGDSDEFQRIAVWAILGGFAGARAAFVIPRLWAYAERPASIIAIWEGGLSIFGGLIGGVGVGMLLAKRAGFDLGLTLDVIAPAIPLGQAIGRWGNFFNQELFGYPTRLPWGIEIDPLSRPPTFKNETTFHPTFLYESLWNLGVVGLLIALERRRALRKGNLFLTYAVAYGLGRFWIELLRVDTEFRLLGLSRNNWFALLIVVIGAAALIFGQGRGENRAVDQDR